ncbi:hypothetical protein F5Y01DRAFT_296929 [Xylaria sp. FL0043]|nr:hypothetical protein F5Y01DRAFT_296929 [Xylaria sp. FL0043]
MRDKTTLLITPDLSPSSSSSNLPHSPTGCSTTTPPLVGDQVPSDVIIQGYVGGLFKFYHAGSWYIADTVIDNGINHGYSAWSRGVLVARGKLAVYDGIDQEMDILNGGALGAGWFTHIPATWKSPPDSELQNYRRIKEAFRKEYPTDLGIWECFTFRGGKYNETSRGSSVHALAVEDPHLMYGLGEKEETSRHRWCVGFRDGFYQYPTLPCSLEMGYEEPPDTPFYVEQPQAEDSEPNNIESSDST